MRKQVTPKKVDKAKTPEQIMQANLRKTMRGLKHNVAEREELWLEFFQDALAHIFTTEVDGQLRMEMIDNKVQMASMIATSALDRYEERWGRC